MENKIKNIIILSYKKKYIYIPLPVNDNVITQYSLKSNNKILEKYPELLRKYNEKCNISNRNNKPRTLFITKENFLQLILTREKINENYKIKNGNSSNNKNTMKNMKRKAFTRVGSRKCIILDNVRNNKQYKEVHAYLNDEDILHTFNFRVTYGEFNLSDVCIIEETEYQKIIAEEAEKKLKEDIKKQEKDLMSLLAMNNNYSPSRIETIFYVFNNYLDMYNKYLKTYTLKIVM